MRLLKLSCILFPILGTVFLTSCSPKVVTNLVKAYSPIVPADSVVVFQFGETVPNSAEAIGRVSVVDRGTTTKCRYDQVLSLAQEETAKVGGNGLAITKHLEPSLWGSSCHQIFALMLRVKNFEVDTLRENPLQDVINLDIAIDKSQREKRIPPANIFNLSMGYGVITSKVYDFNGKEMHNKNGFGWILEYEHVWKSGWGVGAMYSGFRYASPIGDMWLSFIAPEVVLRAKIGRWNLKLGLGVGAFIYHEPYYTAAGVGTNAMWGVEYMVSKQIGIGLSMNALSGSLPDRDGFKLPKDERSGMSRVDFLGGVRFYF